MQIENTSFHQLHEEQKQITQQACNISLQATETLKTATKEFSEKISQIKAEHKKQMNETDTVIKMLVATVIILTGITVYLTSKIIINKC